MLDNFVDEDECDKLLHLLFVLKELALFDGWFIVLYHLLTDGWSDWFLLFGFVHGVIELVQEFKTMDLLFIEILLEE